MNFYMATLDLKEMVKFLWEGREKGLPCWLSQFSHSKVHWENAKKNLVHIMKSGLDAMPLFLLDDLLSKGQKNSKAIFLAYNSSKKRTKNFA